MDNDDSVQMVYSPKMNIPMGEVFINALGTLCVRIKKPKQDQYETITIDNMVELYRNAARRCSGTP